MKRIMLIITLLGVGAPTWMHAAKEANVISKEEKKINLLMTLQALKAQETNQTTQKTLSEIMALVSEADTNNTQIAQEQNLEQQLEQILQQENNAQITTASRQALNYALLGVGMTLGVAILLKSIHLGDGDTLADCLVEWLSDGLAIFFGALGD